MRYIVAIIVFSLCHIAAWGQLAPEKAEELRLKAELEYFSVESVRSAYADFCKSEGYDAALYGEKLKALEQLAGKSDAASQKRIVELKREILLSNPLLDDAKILVGRYRVGNSARSIWTPSLGTQANNWSNQGSAARSGFDAEIAELTNIRGDIKSRTVFKPTNSSCVTDLLLHWDGERILFTAADDNQRWGVYEVNRDGSNFHKVINSEEPDLEFFDGAYMPSGRIIAMSNIGYQGVPCVNGSDQVGNMIAYEPKTGALRRMTFDQDANWHPRVMNNGRLMYVRWEYTDLTHYYSRFVMHANPDGTETKALYGSGGWFPNSIFDVQPLPGGVNTFVGIISGHHGIARSGRLILFDPSKGRKETKGMIQEMPFSKREIIPLIKDELVNGVWPQFIKPYPIDDKYFLVTAKLTPESLWGIYLIDIYDNMTLVAEYEGEGLINPIIVNKRPVPPIIPDRIKPDDKEATVFIQNIYEGEGLPGVPVGEVKKLRVFAYEYTYVNSESDHIAQGIQSGWDIKRNLGEVDVEADGSAMFKIPANTPVSFQPLDSEGRAIQWMRSWVTGMPGEVLSCVGCHEDQNSMPIAKRAIASSKAPAKLQTPEGGVRSFTFDLEIQPILDRNCIACHNTGGVKPNFSAKQVIDLREEREGGYSRSSRKAQSGSLYLSESYLNLHPYVNRQGPEADIYVMKPYEYHASTSELVRLLKAGHHGVELTDKEWRTIYNWIDFNAPCHGRFVYNNVGYCPTDQYSRRIELANKYANGAGVDWKKELDDYAKWMKENPAPAPVRKEVEEPKYKAVKSRRFPFSAEQAQAMVEQIGESRRKIKIAEGVEIEFVRIPAGEFVMGNNERGRGAAPATVVKIDRPFWMSATEITNGQYNVFDPAHDSRYTAQFWKDHVGPGYAANRPAQPVTRISWNQAMEFCRAMSERTGVQLTLPTEAQWEWACRAGSDADFWWGALGEDFSRNDNLADQSLRKMAVSGVDPQPVHESSWVYDFYTFMPREDSVNDGTMTIADVAKYAPNAWGLYDMHGNVAEFTRSAYVPYPYRGEKQDGDAVSVRGGAWNVPPKLSAAYCRESYLKWQPANNVGFRVVIEE
ncbi:MAG: SUMF1/EgtB/PvdO family nonheme iron enzyme [Alistipes sp.]|nr:SUMF1/EgtB/PvdO family nonheme iron enzyme [Alistipes sp.]